MSYLNGKETLELIQIEKFVESKDNQIYGLKSKTHNF